MQICKDTVVTLAYRLSTLDGDLLEEATAGDPAAYLHGGYGGIFAKAEAALEGKQAGDEVDLVLAPAEAFGEYRDDLVRVESADRFPKDVEVGMAFEGVSDSGRHHAVYTVTAVRDGRVVLDGNHPLSGQTLRVSCRVQEVRTATSEELAHGHVHGPGGHHHD
jgi:FKBP-type peptidyl-prolyl cis-trans isomerase SlyD